MDSNGKEDAGILSIQLDAKNFAQKIKKLEIEFEEKMEKEMAEKKAKLIAMKETIGDIEKGIGIICGKIQEFEIPDSDADTVGQNEVALKAQKSNSSIAIEMEKFTANLASNGLDAFYSAPTLPNGLKKSEKRVVQLESPFGFAIKGAAPILISKIYAGMSASFSNALFVGDVILAVNGESMVNAKHDEAVKAINESGNVVELEVQSRPDLHLEPLREKSQPIQDKVPSKNANDGDCRCNSWVTLLIAIICAFALGGILIKLSGMGAEWEKVHKFEVEMLAIKIANASKEQINLNAEMSWKFGELKNEMEKITKEMANLKEETKLKDELENGKRMEKFEVLLGQKITESDKKLEEKIIELEKSMNDSFTKINGKNEQMNEEINKLVEQNIKMNKTIDEMKNHQSASSETENFAVEKNNKWNENDCSSSLTISGNGLVLTGSEYGLNSVRATMPVPKLNLNFQKPSISFYFEVQILIKENTMEFGFGDREFPLKGHWIGERVNSIGIYRKEEMDIDGSRIKIGNELGNFQQGDVIGMGLIHSPANSSIQYFATYNGALLDIIDLPSKFVGLQLFPAASLYRKGDSIKANFGNEPWRYNLSNLIK